ncbi:uncharacterized protein ACA1_190090 [Acanthamoeba castellanii str. Neff]|uniref:Uncharacterized protein n=1 Tax=Acanthamoeba castellanii (strain ATCC 30010 / Neff) TaxID=1257118 RepID=L8GF08_ACACF|nr:uncharacterized protein ACA1_190090 [Acanthamoeba castellanii str. Neff]ELR11323.1 hypothetical protein ACA1_190090 [Acanthamoeba castellanii str. Neff]
MKVIVHVREKVVQVQCGPGTQRLKWLGHVGIARYDNNNGMELGTPKAIKGEDGSVLDMNGIVRDVLKEDAHVWVLIRDDEVLPDM